MGDKDWTSMFVTKLMKTHKGNCHSLPYFYKILCAEIGAEASLALAPNHLYIKHINEDGQWTNVELTNGGFPRDQWIISQMAISVEAIINGIYMAPLSEKENIVMTMFDLIKGYEYQFGNDSFVLSVCNVALTYYPDNMLMLISKANCIRDMIEAEKKKQNPNQDFIINHIAVYKSINAHIDKLGYKDMPVELYQDWVQSVEDEKRKRGITP